MSTTGEGGFPSSMFTPAATTPPLASPPITPAATTPPPASVNPFPASMTGVLGSSVREFDNLRQAWDNVKHLSADQIAAADIGLKDKAISSWYETFAKRARGRIGADGALVGAAQKINAGLEPLMNMGEAFARLRETLSGSILSSSDRLDIIRKNSPALLKDTGKLKNELQRGVNDHLQAVKVLEDSQDRFMRDFQKLMKAETRNISTFEKEKMDAFVAKMGESYEKKVRFHNDAIEGVKYFVGDLEHAGIKLELKYEIPKGLLVGAEQAAGHNHPPASAPHVEPPPPSAAGRVALFAAGGAAAGYVGAKMTGNDDAVGIATGAGGVAGGIIGFLTRTQHQLGAALDHTAAMARGLDTAAMATAIGHVR